MSGESLHAAYQKLDAAAQHVIQICALSYQAVSRKQIVALSSKSGWTDRDGKQLTQATTRQIIDRLTDQNLLVYSSYSYVSANGAVEDLALQDSIRQNWFDKLKSTIDNENSSRGLFYYRPSRYARDLRIAFYGGQVSDFRLLVKRSRHEDPVPLLDPFSRDLFDRLDPILQQMYLLDKVPQVILNPAGGDDILAAFDGWVEAQSALIDELVGCWLDLAIARGDFESLRKLDARTGRKLAEVAGCEALLCGDYERAEQCLAGVLPDARQKGKRKSRIAATHLPALFYLLLLFKRGSAESLTRARLLISAAIKGGTNKYAVAMEAINAAIAFQQSPSSPASLAVQLKMLCTSSLATLLVGYFHRWLLAEVETTMGLSNFVPIGNAYRAAGLAWLAAEACRTGRRTAAQVRRHSGRKAPANARPAGDDQPCPSDRAGTGVATIAFRNCSTGRAAVTHRRGRAIGNSERTPHLGTQHGLQIA